MWFKNLHFYQIKENQLNTPQLAELLAQYPVKELTALERQRSGFIAPSLLVDGPLVHEIAQHRLLRVRLAEKILPPQIINQAIKQQQQQHLYETGQKLTAKAKLTLKEQLTAQFLPQTLTRFTDIDIWWDCQIQVLGLNCASLKQCDLVLDTLRRALTHLHVTPLVAKNAVSPIFNRWLTQKLPEAMQLSNRIELRGDDNSVLHSRNLPLDSPIIAEALQEQQRVVGLAINLDELLSCYLLEDLSCRNLHFATELIDSAQQDNHSNENPLAIIETELALFGPVLRQFYQTLQQWFN